MPSARFFSSQALPFSLRRFHLSDSSPLLLRSLSAIRGGKITLMPPAVNSDTEREQKSQALNALQKPRKRRQSHPQRVAHLRPLCRVFNPKPPHTTLIHPWLQPETEARLCFTATAEPTKPLHPTPPTTAAKPPSRGPAWPAAMNFFLRGSKKKTTFAFSNTDRKNM